MCCIFPFLLKSKPAQGCYLTALCWQNFRNKGIPFIFLEESYPPPLGKETGASWWGWQGQGGEEAMVMQRLYSTANIHLLGTVNSLTQSRTHQSSVTLTCKSKSGKCQTWVCEVRFLSPGLIKIGESWNQISTFYILVSFSFPQYSSHCHPHSPVHMVSFCDFFFPMCHTILQTRFS